jgi:uncharacterized protein DUF429
VLQIADEELEVIDEHSVEGTAGSDSETLDAGKGEAPSWSAVACVGPGFRDRSSGMSATLGIDLSSRPKNTAACWIDWAPGHAEVIALWCSSGPDGAPLNDALLIAAMRGALPGLPAPTKVAVDSPLGWPADFIRGVADLDRWPIPIDEARARLERRATDHWVHRTTGKQPLSVTTDRIAYPAMRAAGLLAHYTRSSGDPVDRTGMTGLVCEAYPDPAIRRLGVWPQSIAPRASYKRAAQDVREAILAKLVRAAPWLALSDSDRERCVDCDDCLDALICALVARAAEQRKTIPPPEELTQEAILEGWIHLPESGSLSELL